MKTIPIIKTVDRLGATSYYYVLGGKYYYFGSSLNILSQFVRNRMKAGKFTKTMGDLLVVTKEVILKCDHQPRIPKIFHYRYE